MNNTLHATSSGEGADVVLLHGLFGQGSNVRGVARALQSDFTTHCVDLPDHGRSMWLERASLDAYAECVVTWMDAEGIDRAHILGHSLGGKVAMQLALSRPERIDKLVVADVAPIAYQGDHDVIISALEAVAGKGCVSRAEAEAILNDAIADRGVVGYLLMGLARTGERHDWRFHLAGLRDGYGRLREPPTGAECCVGSALFLRGADSGYIQPQHESEIAKRFPNSTLITLEEAGHWLHIDQPAAFNAAVGAFLAQ